MKVRDGLMDIKRLEHVNADGLELWQPVMKSPLPISPSDTRVVVAALRMWMTLDLETYDVADSDAAAADVRWSRSTSRDGASRSAAAWPSYGRPHRRPSTRTIAVESEDPRASSRRSATSGWVAAKVSVPRWLEALVERTSSKVCVGHSGRHADCGASGCAVVSNGVSNQARIPDG